MKLMHNDQQIDVLALTAGTGGDSMHNYSTEEQEVGTWIDGSTVYEKTIEIGTMTKDNAWHDISHGISNLGLVITLEGSFTDSTNGTRLPLPTAYRPVDNVGVEITANTTTVKYLNNWIASAIDAIIILRYTKTA